MVFFAAKIPGSITFDREFTNELADKTSPEYQAVAQESEQEVNVPVLVHIRTHFRMHHLCKLINAERNVDLIKKSTGPKNMILEVGREKHSFCYFVSVLSKYDVH